MASVQQLNPDAELARAAQALLVNSTAAQGLQEVLSTNLGPKGTMKLYAPAPGLLRPPAAAR